MATESPMPAISEAAIEAAAIALWNREGGGPDPVPDYIRHDAYATLAAALPHLSTAIRDAALEEAAMIADAIPVRGSTIDEQKAAANTALDISDAIRALKRSEAATRKDAEAAAPKPDVPVVGYWINDPLADGPTVELIPTRGVPCEALVLKADYDAEKDRADILAEKYYLWFERAGTANHILDTERKRADAAEAEVSRLKAAFRDISSFSPEPASHIGPFEQIARHARATTLAALSNQAGANK